MIQVLRAHPDRSVLAGGAAPRGRGHHVSGLPALDPGGRGAPQQRLGVQGRPPAPGELVRGLPARRVAGLARAGHVLRGAEGELGPVRHRAGVVPRPLHLAPAAAGRAVYSVRAGGGMGLHDDPGRCRAVPQPRERLRAPDLLRRRKRASELPATEPLLFYGDLSFTTQEIG